MNKNFMSMRSQKLFYVLLLLFFLVFGYSLRILQEKHKERKKISDTFMLVTQSIEDSEMQFIQQTESIVSDVNSLQAEDSLTRRLKTVVNKVHDEAKGLVNYIEKEKQTMISISNGDDYPVDTLFTVDNVKHKDDIETSSFYMIDESGPQKIYELKNRIDSYRENLLQYCSNDSLIYLSILTSLSTETDSISGEVWGERIFMDMPLVGSLAILKKLQFDIVNAERDIIDMLNFYYYHEKDKKLK